MSEFDNWKEEQERIHNDYDAENAWNAGQQSQQAKIDELQARVDGALKELELITCYRTGNSDNAIDILKAAEK